MLKRSLFTSRIYCNNETKPARLILSHYGFTFVETMVVVALFAVLSVSIFSSLTMGMKVWKRAAALSLTHRKAILGLERLCTELRRAYPYPPIGFFGEKDNLSFANIYRDRILNITYAYSLDDKSIFRSNISRQQVSGPEEEVPARKIITNVENFTLSFYGYDAEKGNFTFFDSWNYTRSGIPLAVRVSLALEDGEVFEKTTIVSITP